MNHDSFSIIEKTRLLSEENSDSRRSNYGHYDSDSQDISNSNVHYRKYGSITSDIGSNYEDNVMDTSYIQFDDSDGNEDFSHRLSKFGDTKFDSNISNHFTRHISSQKSLNRLDAKIENTRDQLDSSSDEFDSYQLFYNMIKTGRQRKKLAVRSRGGEFMMKRKKRRVYFCCLANEIDVEKLHDLFYSGNMNMYGKMYIDVLYLYEKRTKTEINSIPVKLSSPNSMQEFHLDAVDISDSEMNVNVHVNKDGDNNINNTIPIPSSTIPSSHIESIQASTTEESGELIPRTIHRRRSSEVSVEYESEYLENTKSSNPDQVEPIDLAAKLWQLSGKEVYIFNFGAVVFWGYPRGEETKLLNEIRKYIVSGELSGMEFERCQDDMAFVVSPNESHISIANDVITCPEEANIKSRLSVSFAIAQSAVLALFEGRIDRKVQEYKYIPESLAFSGRVKLPQKKLGNMIGDVLSIRHDVNLNTEIMSTPDFFWREDEAVVIYRMTMEYLEMENRTEVVNTRLNMLKDLLVVLQQQSESVLAVQLEWIVIWLIVISIVLEVLSIFSQVLFW